jgi:hypothetical protein
MNPGGSVKDRIALPMIEAAERAGLLKPRRRDRRADEREHRRRPGAGGRGEGLSLHLRHGRQAVRGEAGPAARLRRRGGRLPDRRRRPTTSARYYRVRPVGARDARRLEAGPVPQRRQPAGARGDDRPGDLGGDRGADHAPRRRHSAPAGRSPASAATSRSGIPDRDRRGRPGRIGLLGRHAPPLPDRGDRRGLLALDLRHRDLRRGGAGQRPRLDAHGPHRHAARGDPHGRVVRHRPVGGAAGRSRARRSRRAVRRPPARLGPELHRQALQRPLAAENGLLGPYEEVVDYDWRATRAEVILRGDEIPQPASGSISGA